MKPWAFIFVVLIGLLLVQAAVDLGIALKDGLTLWELLFDG
jgi:hypothetical protein